MQLRNIFPYHLPNVKKTREGAATGLRRLRLTTLMILDRLQTTNRFVNVTDIGFATTDLIRLWYLGLKTPRVAETKNHETIFIPFCGRTVKFWFDFFLLYLLYYCCFFRFWFDLCVVIDQDFVDNAGETPGPGEVGVGNRRFDMAERHQEPWLQQLVALRYVEH